MTHGVHWGGEVISTVEATRWGLKLEDGTAYITVIQDGGLLTSPGTDILIAWIVIGLTASIGLAVFIAVCSIVGYGLNLIREVRNLRRVRADRERQRAAVERAKEQRAANPLTYRK